MPYKDVIKAREAAKERQRKHRVTPVIPSVTPTPESSVTPDKMSHPNVTPYRSLTPSIGEPGHLREWLQDPVMRKKLGAICLSLKRHGHAQDVRLGAFGPDFVEIGDILDQTSALD